MVSAALLGLDYRTTIVNDKVYIIHPPTIHKIAAAAYWLDGIITGEDFGSIVDSLKNLNNTATALSYLIAGDDSLAEELAQGQINEVVEGLETAFTLIDTSNFIRLLALERSAKMLIAKPSI